MGLDVEKNRKKIILETGCMKAGKTDKTIDYAVKLSKHSKYGLTVITNNVNTRDGQDVIISENGTRFPAETADANSPETILDIVYKRDEEKFQDVVIISEANFYKPKLIPVLNILKRESRVIVVEGVDFDFRGDSFGTMGVLKVVADQVNTHYPYCQIVRDGIHCSKLARYTARLLKTDDQDDPDLVDFRRGDEIVRRKYKIAPYYHPTIFVERKEEGEPQVIYAPTCEECFYVPGKKETKKVYNEIKDKGSMSILEMERRFKSVADLHEILDFLVSEKRIQIIGDIYLLTPYEYDIDSGMYVPKDL